MNRDKRISVVRQIVSADLSSCISCRCCKNCIPTECESRCHEKIIKVDKPKSYVINQK